MYILYISICTYCTHQYVHIVQISMYILYISVCTYCIYQYVHIVLIDMYKISDNINMLFFLQHFLCFYIYLKLLINPKQFASEEDHEMIGKHCIWDATGRGARFLCFNNLLFHLASRTCESASLLKSETKVKPVEEFNFPYNVIEFYIERHKTQSLPTDSTTYPHRDTMLQDVAWTMGYHSILNEK